MTPIRSASIQNFQATQIEAISKMSLYNQNRQLNHPKLLKDTQEISTVAEAVQKTGLDPMTSSRYFSESEMKFNFNYQDAKVMNINASGIFAMQSRTMEMNFSFEVRESDLNPESQSNRIFKFNMQISMQQTEMQQLNINKNKESLPDFLMRIAKIISKYAVDKDKEIAALILDKEDVKDMIALDGGKILKDIHAAINILYVTNQILNKDKEDVAVYVQRKKETLVEYQGLKSSQFNISFSVEEITQKISQDNEEDENQEIKPEAVQETGTKLA